MNRTAFMGIIMWYCYEEPKTFPILSGKLSRSSIQKRFFFLENYSQEFSVPAKVFVNESLMFLWIFQQFEFYLCRIHLENEFLGSDLINSRRWNFPKQNYLIIYLMREKFSSRSLIFRLDLRLLFNSPEPAFKSAFNVDALNSKWALLKKLRNLLLIQFESRRERVSRRDDKQTFRYPSIKTPWITM